MWDVVYVKLLEAKPYTERKEKNKHTHRKERETFLRIIIIKNAETKRYT